MPWKRLAFDQEKLDELMTKYGAQGFPTVVLLDRDGSVISTEAGSTIVKTPFSEWKDAIIAQKAAEEKFNKDLEELKSKKFRPSEFFQSNVMDKDNNVVPSEQFANKTIGLYFSAHWCPPCRSFTPQLSKKYLELIEQNKSFEIIFCSSDQTEEQYNEYYAEMPWKRLVYNDRETKNLLSAFFEVEGIPTLVLINEAEDWLINEGRSALFEAEFDQLSQYKPPEKPPKGDCVVC
jgi:nucleoredoxin